MVSTPNFPVDSFFSQTELDALAAFYARERAKSIRQRLRVDPWAIVARHRAMERASYDAVMELVVNSGDRS